METPLSLPVLVETIAFKVQDLMNLIRIVVEILLTTVYQQ